ncbi:hypothetical protein IFM89_026609 [Coptis chinensis]|uniref:protein-serine/threonine phosphatase n=1 Tax=Coptis chinensis TaxID=261450 RepID=A0A835HFM9_9MAGN|nr:hypothetical protein IFM89_026609 [Coptis chinensis]
MSCAVASSPVFSPSTHHHHHGFSSSSSSPCSSSSSPFRLRLQKSSSSPSGLRNYCDCNTNVTTTTTTTNNNSSVLKRKRPMRIDIPVTSLSFGGMDVNNKVGSEEEREIEVEREGWSVYCKRGKREKMEDRFSAVDNFHGDSSKQAFFGVFDGHGGAKAAEFAKEHLHKNIMDELTKRTDVVDAINQGYLTTDLDFLKENVHGGSCCVTALISKGDLIVSNAGDCRAVICRGGVAEALTSDHRPSREDERQRIETQGGYVDCRHGVWRLQGSLAVSRGIGDQHLKQWVVAEPETKIVSINQDCEFLLLASDGLWDKVSNQEAVDITRPLCVDSVKPAALSACKRLAELAVKRGSLDDISVMVIQLRNFFR